MKISYRKNYITEDDSHTAIKLNADSLIISDDKHVIKAAEGSKQIYFEGEIYYHSKFDVITQIGKNEYGEFLKKQLSSFDVVDFINSVEGIYTAVFVDPEKNEAVIFCDYLNRKNLYYIESENSFVAATSLNTIIPELTSIKYNQQAFLSYLTVGYTPIHQTFYEGVNRFSSNEYVKIAQGKTEHIFFEENYKIENYDESQIEEYDNLLTNSILSRSSDENFVLNSGGWDSTSIIYHLTKNYDNKNINSVICETILRNGESFNIYEADKVKKISDYYGINSEKIIIDFNDKNLLNDWEARREELKNYHTYFFVDMPKAVHEISEQKKSASIFSGEASDSIHNFGFSQFVAVTYNNRELREYGDKMKSYLFGPSFFSKLLNGTYDDDKVFQFYTYYYGESCCEDVTKFNKKDFLYSYFKSFMLSGERIPFAKANGNKFAKDLLISSNNGSLKEGIFRNPVNNVTPENIYYYLLQLYRDYHFHSPQIESKHVPLRNSGENCKIPFLDMSLVKYMYSMPESWGRGLELKPTKYPLRYLAKEKWNIPMNILEEAGAHSYISESDSKWNYSGGKWNMYCETIYNSVFGDYYKEMFSEIDLEKYFSPESFNTEEMKRIVKDFIEGKQDLENASFIYKLGVLFFIELY
ncbi:MAG: hypothetical protein JST55_04090 [Bacteroidetes bacterium]|nr:hypothetical protein [Bacteroidota bacterium]